jgi:hypothetical protein
MMMAPEAGGETLRFVMALLIIEPEVVGGMEVSQLPSPVRALLRAHQATAGGDDAETRQQLR